MERVAAVPIQIYDDLILLFILRAENIIMALKRNWNQLYDAEATERYQNASLVRQIREAGPQCLACSQNAPTMFCDINCTTHSDGHWDSSILREDGEFCGGLISPPMTSPEQSEYSPCASDYQAVDDHSRNIEPQQDSWDVPSALWQQPHFHETIGASRRENAWTPATSTSSCEGNQISLQEQQSSGPCFLELSPTESFHDPLDIADRMGGYAESRPPSSDVGSTLPGHQPLETTPASSVFSSLWSLEMSLALYTRDQLETLRSTDAVYNQNV